MPNSSDRLAAEPAARASARRARRVIGKRGSGSASGMPAAASQAVAWRCGCSRSAGAGQERRAIEERALDAETIAVPRRDAGGHMAKASVGCGAADNARSKRRARRLRSGAAGRAGPSWRPRRVSPGCGPATSRRRTAVLGGEKLVGGGARLGDQRAPARPHASASARICGRCQIMSPMPGSGWITAIPQRTSRHRAASAGGQRASARPQPSSRKNQPPIGMLT